MCSLPTQLFQSGAKLGRKEGRFFSPKKCGIPHSVEFEKVLPLKPSGGHLPVFDKKVENIKKFISKFIMPLLSFFMRKHTADHDS